jgi:predicted DsbA family dithiol-disulfide isomerase
MHDYLFKHGQTNTEENLRKSAAGLGLQMDKFDRDLNEQTHKARVDEDIESGESSGVKNTPFFYQRRPLRWRMGFGQSLVRT